MSPYLILWRFWSDERRRRIKAEEVVGLLARALVATALERDRARDMAVALGSADEWSDFDRERMTEWGVSE